MISRINEAFVDVEIAVLRNAVNAVGAFEALGIAKEQIEPNIWNEWQAGLSTKNKDSLSNKGIA